MIRKPDPDLFKPAATEVMRRKAGLFVDDAPDRPRDSLRDDLIKPRHAVLILPGIAFLIGARGLDVFGMGAALGVAVLFNVVVVRALAWAGLLCPNAGDHQQ